VLLGAIVVRGFEGDLGTALVDLVPRGEGAAWAWTNLVAVVLALVAWPAALTILLRLRRAR
jgi:hypothetical protein